MRLIPILLAVMLTVMAGATICHAGCNCDDWMEKDGYCVDYIKERIPSFPIPTSDSEIMALKNKSVAEVAAGDVAIFDLGNYWHVAYVEQVHRDARGAAVSIDVTEMNYGRKLSFADYQKRWGSKDESEWRRAVCCGVTRKFDRMGARKNIAISSINQIWSPTIAAQEADDRPDRGIVEKLGELVDRFFQFMEKAL